jgi:hypothetical protein
MADRGETGEPGRKGDTGRVGDTGRTGDQGETGRGPRGYPGAQGAQGAPGAAGTQGTAGATAGQGLPGISLSIEQLEAYVRRLEGRYRRIALWLTIALVATATAGLGSLAWTAEGLDDRVAEQEAQRREAIIGVCEALNAQNARLVRFREALDPGSVKLARETFIQADCRAEARRLTGGQR